MKNYFLEVAKLMLQDNGWTVEKAPVSEIIMVKGVLKEARISGNTVKFHFDDNYICSVDIDSMLKRTSSLLNYFIQE